MSQDEVERGGGARSYMQVLQDLGLATRVALKNKQK